MSFMFIYTLIYLHILLFYENQSRTFLFASALIYCLPKILIIFIGNKIYFDELARNKCKTSEVYDLKLMSSVIYHSFVFYQTLD